MLTSLDLDLSNTSAEPPVLPQQTRRCRVGDAGVKKTEKGARRCVIPLILEEPAVDKQGNSVAVGFRTTKSFLIDESGGWTKERGAEEFLRAKMAIMGVDEATAKTTPHDLATWPGREVNVTFLMNKKGEQEHRLAKV